MALFMLGKGNNICTMKTLKGYTGNKGIDGLWQWIINRIPPHKVYYELFAGSATIARALPAHSHKTLVDIDPGTVKMLQKELGSSTVKSICADALQLLSTVGTMAACTDNNNCTGQLGSVKTKVTVPPAMFVSNSMVRTAQNNCTSEQIHLTVPDRHIMIYADPPYRFINRRGKRNLYKYEMTDEQHLQFVIACSTVNANCMISHPENDMYDKHLHGWTKEKFTVSYHGHVTQECIYYNYPKPSVLQTYDYVGSDCWDRQRVKRKIERLARKLADLPALERNAVIARAIHQIR